MRIDELFKFDSNQEHQISEELKADIEETVVNEGIARGIVKFLSTATGASMGASAGGYGGAGISGALLGALSLAGLVSPSLLIGGTIGAGAVGTVFGLIAGGKFGLKLARNVTRSDTEKYARELVKTTKKRDEVIVKLDNAVKEDVAIDRLKNEVEKLTREQKDIAKKLEKSLRNDYEKEAITQADYSNSKKLVAAAKEGKLTYIDGKSD